MKFRTLAHSVIQEGVVATQLMSTHRHLMNQFLKDFIDQPFIIESTHHRRAGDESIMRR